MADVWIGNLAKNNNLEIICVSRPKNFITQIEQTETIYNSYSNNDKIQTNLVNLTYSVKNLSIIYLKSNARSITSSGFSDLI
jgi:hypothetical protein